jgi:hypothetical protein
MAIKITSIKEAVGDNGLKLLVHAPAGAGKTRLAASAETPTLIINCEGGLLSIADAGDHVQSVKVESLSDLDEILEMLINDLNEGDQKFDWVCLDSITEIAEQILQKELAACSDPRKSYPAFQAEVVRLLKAFRDLPLYNVYMSCKQTRNKDDNTGITLYEPLMPGNKLGPQLAYLFDEVFALRVETDEGAQYRTLQTGRDVMFDAKDRSGKLDMFEPASLTHIYNKIHG